VSSAQHCPQCGAAIQVYRNPVPTVDVVVQFPDRTIVLIKRKNPPYGWALPGGFVDYGESLEQAATREAAEETSLQVQLLGLVGVYSSPKRDPRQHTLSVTFAARPLSPETLQAGDDASSVSRFALDALPELAFDHADIVADYHRWVLQCGDLTQCGVSKGRSVCIL